MELSSNQPSVNQATAKAQAKLLSPQELRLALDWQAKAGKDSYVGRLPQQLAQALGLSEDELLAHLDELAGSIKHNTPKNSLNPMVKITQKLLAKAEVQGIEDDIPLVPLRGYLHNARVKGGTWVNPLKGKLQVEKLPVKPGKCIDTFRLTADGKSYILRVYRPYMQKGAAAVSPFSSYASAANGLFLNAKQTKDVVNYHVGNPARGWELMEDVTNEALTNRTGPTMQELGYVMGDANKGSCVNGIRVDLGGVLLKAEEAPQGLLGKIGMYGTPSQRVSAMQWVDQGSQFVQKGITKLLKRI